MMKFVSLIFLILFASPAFGFACEYYGDHNEIELNGAIEDLQINQTCSDGLERVLKSPTIFFLTSPGGNVEKIVNLVHEFRAVAGLAYSQSGVIPIVIVREQCSSACLPVLASLNQLAEEGAIHLIVHDKTRLGFHGCSREMADSNKRYFTHSGTMRYLGYFRAFGGSREWLKKHEEFFRSPRLTELYPDFDIATLRDANLIDHAVIASSNELYGRDFGHKEPSRPLDFHLVTHLFAN